MAKNGGYEDKLCLHLCITIGKALSESIKKVSIYYADDKFIFRRSQSGRILLLPLYIKELREEFEAQIKEFLSYGFTLKHIDSHHYIHFSIPRFIALYPLAKKYSVKSVRAYTRAKGPIVVDSRYISEDVPQGLVMMEDTYTIDADKIEDLITEKTSAIIPVHVYGNVCDVEKIDAIAKKHNLKVIYDAAHVFGVKIGDRGIGTYGDISMFSFHATKVFNTIEGGALTYRDIGLKSRIEAIRNFGITSQESVDFVGSNAKMNEFQSAMGVLNLKYLDGEIQKRRIVAERYKERLKNTDGIKICKEQSEVISNYAYFPVVFDGYRYTRDEVMEKLSKKNIFARKYFYPITNEFSCYKGKYRGETPVAKRISENVLTLPMYADLSTEDVDRICDIILK